MASRPLQSPSSQAPLVAVVGSMAIGGTSTFLVNLAYGLRERGFALPLVVMSTRNEFRNDLADAGAVLHEIDRRGPIYEDRLRWVYQTVAAHRPRMVLSTLSPESFEVLRVLPARVLRVGMLQTDDPGVYGLVSTYRAWLDVAVGVSETICSKILAMPESAGLRIECIPYGVRFWSAAPERSPRPGEPLRVVYVGRLAEEQKRISRVAATMRRCAGRGMTFTLVGSGSEEGRLRSEFEGNPAVRFTGPLPPAGVAEELAGQDVFLLLSDFEGLPLALIEAMGMGVVPVVSDLESGIRDVVTADCGIRVPVGDLDATVRALEELGADPARRLRMAGACVAAARGAHDAVGMADRYLELAESVCSSEAPPIWPAGVDPPTPLCLRPRWLYRPPARWVRRFCRRLGLTGRQYRHPRHSDPAGK